MQIKFLQLNLFEGGKFFAEIKAFLEKEKPDIACFQEAYNEEEANLPQNFRTIQFLKQILPDYHYYFSPELKISGKVGSFDNGNLIFSKFPFEEKHTVFYDKPYGEYKHPENYDKLYDFSTTPKNLQYAKVITPEKPIHVFNTHGIWGFDGDDNERRLHMAEVIIEKIKGKTPILMSGDFNLFPTTQAVRNIEKYLVNVFDNELKRTFNLRKKPHPGNWDTSVVDMVFVSPDVIILEKKCPDVDVSDHLPLVCRFEV